MGGIIGGIFSGMAASKAAKQQAASAKEDLAFQKETRDLIFDRMDPFYQPGINAQNALAYEFGIGELPMIGGTAPTIETVLGGPTQLPQRPSQQLALGHRRRQDNRSAPQQVSQTAPNQYRVNGQLFNTYDDALAYANANKTGGTAYQGYKASPGYQNRLNQGNAAINALAGARGGLNSGRTLQDLATFNQNLASEDYGNYIAGLAGLASGGQAAAGATANAATNAASGVSNALSAIGNAKSAGTVGFANGITGGINNQLALWQYQKQQNPGMQSTGLMKFFGV